MVACSHFDLEKIFCLFAFTCIAMYFSKSIFSCKKGDEFRKMISNFVNGTFVQKIFSYKNEMIKG